MKGMRGQPMRDNPAMPSASAAASPATVRAISA